MKDDGTFTVERTDMKRQLLFKQGSDSLLIFPAAFARSNLVLVSRVPGDAWTLSESGSPSHTAETAL